MDTLLADILFHTVGRLFLFLRYRNEEKRKAVLVEKYFDSYRSAGLSVILRPFALICFLLMLVFIAVVLYNVTS
ncbi:hypothetical protein GFS24_05980 [Chitinophaga sp. SYP-B3965]|uniref:hypothetical protein n=1 Tax=Chitinophaga sp. SYP-B3965 TaxID=2663120 RepID=UPI001299CBEF|nr:hypothetical protein [Chitinophaga sp. SYP-B3965]MRG44652.1 hypothetical protein [Chitinophaga sp. SYP-B3965]